jgi:hypothetical protein
MRYISWCLLAIGLTGCAGQQVMLGFNRYVIDTLYGDEISYASAVQTLTDDSIDICGQDYRKVNDYDTALGSKRLLIWEIGCRGVVRSDTRFGTSNTRSGTSNDTL